MTPYFQVPRFEGVATAYQIQLLILLIQTFSEVRPSQPNGVGFLFSETQMSRTAVVGWRDEQQWRLKLHRFSSDVQLRTTVIGGLLLSSSKVTTRKRCPSGLGTY